jgi:hypothetical protein
MSAPRAASGEPRVAALIAGPGSGIRLRVIFPRLGVAAVIAPGSPRRRRRRGRAQAVGALPNAAGRSGAFCPVRARFSSVLPCCRLTSFRNGNHPAALVSERFGQAWRPANFNCGIKEAPGTQDAPVHGSQRAANCCVDTTCPGNCGLRWRLEGAL